MQRQVGIATVIIYYNSYSCVWLVKLAKSALVLNQTAFVHLYLQACGPSEISVESTVSVMFTPGREQQQQQHLCWFQGQHSWCQ